MAHKAMKNRKKTKTKQDGVVYRQIAFPEKTWYAIRRIARGHLRISASSFVYNAALAELYKAQIKFDGKDSGVAVDVPEK